MSTRTFFTLMLIFSLMGYPTTGYAQAQSGGSDDVALVPWGSKESAERLSRSTRKGDFFSLSNHFASQDNKIVCGLASSAIVLNALRLRKVEDLPKDEASISSDERAYLPNDYSPFLPKYTQNNVLSENTKRKIEVLGKPIEINGKQQKDFGLQLRQLAQLLTSHGLNVTVRVVDGTFASDVAKRELIQNLENSNDFVLVNYARKSLAQLGGGHISPIGAYEEKSDSFLVMDVNPNTAPWVWVKSRDLISAMRTFDTVENRGYLLISDGR